MNNKLTKTLALGTAMLLGITTLSGCGEKKASDNNLNAGAEMVLSGDEIYPIQCDDTLTYWMESGVWQSSYENFGDTPLGKQIAKDTGVKVTYTHPATGQGAEQFQLLLASDELSDMVNHEWNNYPGGPDKAIKENYILKLNDVFEKYAPALSKLLKDKPEWDRQIKTDNGAYYAFPFLLEEGILQVSSGPIIRADWLRDLGLEAPETIDEWEQVLTAFKEKKGVAIPFVGDMTRIETVFAPAFGVYSDFYKNGDKIVYGPAEPEYKDFLMKMNDWYKKGLLDKDFAVDDGKNLNARMLNGEAGSTYAWAGSGVGGWLRTNKDVSGYDLLGAKYPAKEKGATPEYSALSSPVYMTCCTGISTKCKNVELAARFLDYGFTEKGHNLFNFGIEGESFNWVEKNGEKYPQYSDLVMHNPDGLSVTEALSHYVRACYNGIMVQDTRYIEQYYELQQQKDAQKNWSITNMADHMLPQLYVLDSESDRDSEITANIKTYVDEMTVKFITGTESFDNYDQFTEQLEKFGIDDAIKFRTDAYKRYTER